VLDGSSNAFLDTCFVSDGWNRRGVNIFTDDPRFIHESGGDFHLDVGSTCADTGNPALLPGEATLDIDDQPRSITRRVDIGADERFWLIAK
jgi:hypothetical protein